MCTRIGTTWLGTWRGLLCVWLSILHWCLCWLFWGFGSRWVKGFSLATHLGGLVINPVVSSLVWLQFLRSAPRFPRLASLPLSLHTLGHMRLSGPSPLRRPWTWGKGWQTIYVELVSDREGVGKGSIQSVNRGYNRDVTRRVCAKLNSLLLDTIHVFLW